jgi:tRNA-specific 2-thiouridylase
LEDANDARRVADVLGIPFYVWDFSAEFHQQVVENFLDEYAQGRTPNPCLRCNEQIKFAAVCDRALNLGFDAVVTGHYARLVHRPDGLVELHRSADAAKDQSYVLGVLTQDQLQHAWFPLGDTVKDQVRREAARRGLTVADKPDSYDICFIPEGDTAGYLYDKLGRRPGPIIDQQGQVLGQHPGVVGFTIGQRKHLRLSRPASDGRPRYVLRLDPVRDTLVVGPRQDLRVDRLRATDPVWCDTPPGPDFAATVQLRAHADEVPARVHLVEGQVVIDLEQPTYGIAPGQTAVLYQASHVLGSATIAATAGTPTSSG